MVMGHADIIQPMSEVYFNIERDSAWDTFLRRLYLENHPRGRRLLVTMLLLNTVPGTYLPLANGIGSRYFN